MKLIVSNSLVAGDIVVLRMKYKKSVQVVKYHTAAGRGGARL